MLLLRALPVCASARLLAAQCPDGTPPPCRTAARVAVPTANSVAVLYFDNLSRDTADAYLADGLTEELIVRLQQVRRLDVKSRFASQRFRGRAATDPAALGRSLNASYLVSGSVQKAGNRVRLRVELLRAATGATVWSAAPERASGDILTVESDIAGEVATAITGTLLPAERSTLARQPTRNPQAYDLYLRAIHAADSWSGQDARQALDYLDRAIALDSSFALAYAVQASAWTTLADGFIAPREAYGRARAAAEHALRIDSTLSLGWSMLGSAVFADSSLDYVERLARRGIALDPRVNWGHTLLGLAEVSRSHIEGGLASLRRGFEADTLDAVGAAVYLWSLSMVKDTSAMRGVLARAAGAFSPEDMDAYTGTYEHAAGRDADAVRHLSWRYYGGFLAGEYVAALVALGRRDQARAVIDSMIALRQRPEYTNPLPIARAFAALGDADQAFVWLERAFDDRTQWLLVMNVDPVLAPLRNDPRFQSLSRRFVR